MLLKKILIIAFVGLLFMGAYTKTEAEAPHYDQKLIQLTKEAEKVHFSINKWSIYAREQKQYQDLSEYESNKAHLESQFPQFNWKETYNRENGCVTLTGTKEHHQGIAETLSLYTYPQKSGYEAYFIYVVNGKKWSLKSWKKFSPTVQKKMATLFNKEPQIFSCVTGESGDTMDIVLSKKANAIRMDFHAKKIEQIKEKTFISQSAYTNVWNESIQTNQRKMNLQIALRKTQNTIDLTLGTPIITSEY